MAMLLCQNSPSFLGNAISLRTKHRTVRVSHRFASVSVRADFDLWRDVGGKLITPIPNNAPLQQKGVRTWPPRASWYKVNNNPRTLPLHWDESKKSLAKHKEILMNACKANNATEWQKKLIMAIAMQETEHMWGRDPSKDRLGDAKNVWCLNLNLDMLKQVGYQGEDLTRPEHLEQVIAYLLKWFNGKATVDGKPQKTPYVKSTLNFIRYGRTGYNKASTNETVEIGKHWVPIKQICREYRSAISSMITSMEAEPPQGCEPLWDEAKGTAVLNDSRLGIEVPWV